MQRIPPALRGRDRGDQSIRVRPHAEREDAARSQVVLKADAKLPEIGLAFYPPRRLAADCTAGSSRAINTPMIEIVTSNSTSVSARRFVPMALAPRPAGPAVGGPIHRAYVVMDEDILVQFHIVMIFVLLQES